MIRVSQVPFRWFEQSTFAKISVSWKTRIGDQGSSDDRKHAYGFPNKNTTTLSPQLFTVKVENTSI